MRRQISPLSPLFTETDELPGLDNQLVIPGCATWRRPQMCNCTSGNPYSRWWLWIPGSLVSLAPRNAGEGVVQHRLPPVRIEPLFQSLPAIRVIILQRRRFRGMCRYPLRIARLEHEGHGAGELDRL